MESILVFLSRAGNGIEDHFKITSRKSRKDSILATKDVVRDWDALCNATFHEDPNTVGQDNVKRNGIY